MTYNFDPDRWYDNQRARIEHRRDSGEIGAEEFQAELERLEERYDEIVRRLDRPFELPNRQKE